ncbi:MAG: hypothetical protein K0S09_1729 [Sphingobacteriaceae bacterium]|jgi:hypothetical protein|nr:hypothetical protein [Sphingobacteriaceae bacterium]
MKFPIVHFPRLKVNGMALFPFILVGSRESKKDAVLINHEKIHLWQQIELLILPFYLLYALNYLYNRFRFKDHYSAYMNIVFEKEAYAHEADLSYLSQRKFMGWIGFL